MRDQRLYGNVLQGGQALHPRKRHAWVGNRKKLALWRATRAADLSTRVCSYTVRLCEPSLACQWSL